MWIHNNQRITKDNFPKDMHGFVYLMGAVIDGEKKYYIGKKTVYSNRKKALTKKELEGITDKRLKTYKRILTFIPFEKYFSSNTILQQAHVDGIKIKRVILHFCKTKTELTYQETRYLFKSDALLRDEFLNDNILGKFYKSKIFVDDEEDEEE